MANILVWTDIPVTDLDRAIAFYSAVLGQPVEKQTGPGFEFGLLPGSGEGASGCLAVDEAYGPTENGPLVYLNADGRLDEAIQAATTNGGTVLREKHPIGPYGFRAILRDTEGNRIALHSQTA